MAYTPAVTTVTTRRKQTPAEELSDKPTAALMSIARNDSATREYRLASVRILNKTGRLSEVLRYPELTWLLDQVRNEQAAEDEVVDIVTQATEQEFEPGPLRASVTTATMFSE